VDNDGISKVFNKDIEGEIATIQAPVIRYIIPLAFEIFCHIDLVRLTKSYVVKVI